MLADVEAALRAHYSFDARALGQPVLQSDVIAVVHAVPGVVAVDLDFLYGDAALHRQLASRSDAAARRRACASAAACRTPAELLTLDPGPLTLKEMT